MPDDRNDGSPVFVDASGRRRRALRMLAVMVGCAVVGFGALLIAELLGAPVSPSALFAPAPPSSTTAPGTPMFAPATTSDDSQGSPVAGNSRSVRGNAGSAQVVSAPRLTTNPVAAQPSPTPTAPPTGGSPTTKTHGRPTDLSTPPGHSH